MKQRLFQALPQQSRYNISETALLELVAVMRYHVSGETRPWCSLPLEGKRSWLTQKPVEFLQGVAENPSFLEWMPHAPAYGLRELQSPELIHGKLNEREMSFFSFILRMFSGEEWAQALSDADLQRLGMPASGGQEKPSLAA